MVERPGYEEGENGEKEPFDCGMHGLRRSSAESRSAEAWAICSRVACLRWWSGERRGSS